MQQVVKDGNIREQFCADEGKIFLDYDYKQLELCALSQDCLFRYGVSALGERINTGQDVHRWFGVEIIKNRIPPEEAVKLSNKDARQGAKASLFG